MVDLKAIADELHHAREACAEAQAAICDLENLVWEVAASATQPAADDVCDRWFRSGGNANGELTQLLLPAALPPTTLVIGEGCDDDHVR